MIGDDPGKHGRPQREHGNANAENPLLALRVSVKHVTSKHAHEVRRHDYAAC